MREGDFTGKCTVPFISFPHVAQREAAIVTPIPGTTRDVLQLTLDIGGMPVVVADTAGLRKTKDLVENIGIEKGVGACVFFIQDL